MSLVFWTESLIWILHSTMLAADICETSQATLAKTMALIEQHPLEDQVQALRKALTAVKSQLAVAGSARTAAVSRPTAKRANGDRLRTQACHATHRSRTARTRQRCPLRGVSGRHSSADGSRCSIARTRVVAVHRLPSQFCGSSCPKLYDSRPPSPVLY